MSRALHSISKIRMLIRDGALFYVMDLASFLIYVFVDHILFMIATGVGICIFISMYMPFIWCRYMHIYLISDRSVSQNEKCA